MVVTWKKLVYEDDAILKSLLTAAGDIIYASGASTPAKLAKGANGEVLTLAAGLPSWAVAPGGATVVIKPDDEIVNNSETLQNDDDLVIAVGANDIWLIHLLWFFSSPSISVDIDYAWAVPSGGAIRRMDYWSSTIDAAIKDATAEVMMDVIAEERYAQQICLYIGGGTAGNLQFQWAQHVATAEDTKVKANSLLLCHQIA